MLRRAAILLTLVLVPALALAQSAPDMFKDVARDHWAYQAAESLRARGFLVGYPDEHFRGKRTLTRYEFAIALDRALQRLPGGPSRPGSAGVSLSSPRPLGEEASNLRRLTTEFRAELAAMGNDQATVMRRIDEAQKLSSEILKLSSSPSPPPGRPTGSERADSAFRLGLNTRLTDRPLAAASLPGDYGHLLAGNNSAGSTRLPGFSLAPVAGSSPGQPTLSFLDSQGRRPLFGGPGGELDFTLGSFDHNSRNLALAASGLGPYRFGDDGGLLSVDGARLRTQFGGVALEAFGGRANSLPAPENRSANSPLAGTPLEPLGARIFPFASRPTGASASGSTGQPQLTGFSAGMGLRVLDGGHIRLSSMELAAPAGSAISGVHTVGADMSLRLSNRVRLFGDWGKSIAYSSSPDSAAARLNSAFNAAVQYDAGSLNLSAGYRYVDPNYFAPGYWGRIGSWLNPTNIEGPTVRAAWDISPRFGINVGGEMLSAARDGSLQGGLSEHDTITRALVGIRWNLSQSLETTLDWEGVYWQTQGAGRAPGGASLTGQPSGANALRLHPTEHYFTLGTGYSLSRRAKLRLLYQVGYDGRGSLLGPSGTGTRNTFNVITGQVAVKF